MRLALRNALPVGVVTLALVFAFTVMVIAVLLIPATRDTGKCGAGPCIQPIGLRYVVGLLLIASAPLNGMALTVVIRAGLRPPLDFVMDERVQTFMFAFLASCAFAVVGLYEVLYDILPAIGFVGGVADLMLLLGILIYCGLPLLFLRSLLRHPH